VQRDSIAADDQIAHPIIVERLTISDYL
jgi:hypothetical protein